MVDAAIGDIEAMKSVQSPVRDRVGASVMRDIGMTEEQVIAKYG